MAFTPTSEFYLLNVPLESDYNHTVKFATLQAQYDYMVTQTRHTFSDFTYIRKDDIIKVNAHIDTLYDSNYVMYQNENFTDKWFYAFITKMEYVSDMCTAIYIKTDVWQTWFSQIIVRKSFVVREHVTSDTIGLHIIDEGLECGEYMCSSQAISGNNLSDIIYTVVYANSNADGILLPDTELDGVWTGLNYYTGTAQAVRNVMEALIGDGKESSIMCVYGHSESLNTTQVQSVVNNPTRPSSIDGYSPKNNKLFTYPYTYLLVSNAEGQNVKFLWECFNGNPNFSITGKKGISPKTLLWAENYRNIGNYDEVLSLSEYPTIAWGGDSYAQWLNVNKNSLANFFGQSALSMINPKNVVDSGNAILSQIATISDKSNTPNSVHGSQSSSLNFILDRKDFYFKSMTIKNQLAKIIDNYFEMFGYKVNDVKIPNMDTRPYWNYVKTIDVNLDGNIPSDDMKEIKSIFNNGVTFWKSPTNIGDYSLNNH